MLFFEVFRQLDIRLFQTMAAVDPTYGSCAKYVFDRDNLILLGTDHSIRLDILAQKVGTDNPIKNWDIENEAMLWFSEDSMEAGLVRLIIDAYRKWNSLDSNITDEYFYNELNLINNYLAGYDLKVYVDDSGMSVFNDGEAFTFEQAIELIMEVDANRMDADGIDKLINEAFFYRNMDRFEEAAMLLEKVARYVDHSQPIYTDTIFSLAETYYFCGNYERAIMLYYRVNMKHIVDPNDFYMHLGHALLDSKMRKYDRHLRIYYRSQLDPKYADTHRQAVAAAKASVSEVFTEYESTCYECGKKKYEEYRNSLPKEADDIDELLNIYEKPEEKPDENVHKKITGIKLAEPEDLTLDEETSLNDYLSEALEHFMSGNYQQSFELYIKLLQKAPDDSDYFTWIQLQLAKLYLFFGESKKAVSALSKCDLTRFGVIYKLEDFLLLFSHAQVVFDNLLDDNRYKVMLRGKFDAYFAQYDREYSLCMRDKRLVKSYTQYEKECMQDSRDHFRNDLKEIEGGGFIKRLFSGLFKNTNEPEE